MSEYINASTDVLGGSVIRHTLNTTTPGQAVIRKIIAGPGITITSSGVDAGTGDVVISINSTGSGGGDTGSGNGSGNGGGTPTAVGSVTSVNMTAPEGMFVLGAPITSAGTIALRLSSGYVIPLYADVQEGKTAYSWGDHALAGYQHTITLTTTGTSGASTFINDVLNIPNYAVTINNNADYRVITGSGTANTLNASTKLEWYNDYGILTLFSTASWGFGAEIDFNNTDVNGTVWGFYGGSTSVTGLMLYQYQPSQVELAYWNTDRYAVRSDVKIAWSSTLLSWGTPDIALSRESSGLLQVNTGTSNSYADVKAKVYRATQGFYAYRTGGNQAFIGLDTSGAGGKEWYMGSVASNGVDPGSIMWNNETDQLSPMSLNNSTLKLKVDTGIAWTTTSTTDSVTYTVGLEVAAANTLKINNGSTGYGYLHLNNLKATTLAGTGTRMVVADVNGLLSTQAIPTGGVTDNIYTANGTLTGNRTVTMSNNWLAFNGGALRSNTSFYVDPTGTYTNYSSLLSLYQTTDLGASTYFNAISIRGSGHPVAGMDLGINNYYGYLRYFTGGGLKILNTANQEVIKITGTLPTAGGITIAGDGSTNSYIDFNGGISGVGWKLIVPRGIWTYQHTSFPYQAIKFTGTGTDQGMVLQTYSTADAVTLFSSGSMAIGTTGEDTSAIFQVNSTAKGVLFPRMTASQKDAISSPTTGLMAYQTDGSEGMYLKLSSAWKKILTTSDLGTSTGVVNGLVSGGQVTWRGTGFIYDVAYSVYYIGGAQYTAAASSVTLGAADVSNPRLDVVAVTSSGTVIVVPGTPAANPVKPVVDSTTQLELTSILVPANATSPTGITSSIVYDEVSNPNYTNAATGVTVSFNSTTTPYSGTVVTNVAASTTGTRNIDYTRATTDTIANYSVLKFAIRLVTAWTATSTLGISFYNGATQVSTEITISNGLYGFAMATTGTYQLIQLNIRDFRFTSAVFNRVRFRLVNSVPAFLLDRIELQGGVVQTNIQANNIYTSDGTLAGLRTVTLNGNSLTFQGSSSSTVFAATGAVSFGGAVTLAQLAGTGDRLVAVDTTGISSAVSIGSGLSLSGGILTATGGASGTVTATPGGTSGYLAKFSSSTNIVNSIISESGSVITIAGSLSLNNTVTATSFIKSGGTSSQYLMADGSVTTSTFLTSGSFVSDYDSAITGLRNSSNTVFTLTNNYQSGTTKVYVNGVRYSPGVGNDYTESSSNQITFANPPDSGDLILVDYIKS